MLSSLRAARVISGDYGGQWPGNRSEWGFGSKDITKKSIPFKIAILLNKKRESNEISGTVQFSRNISHSELRIELTGILKVVGDNNEIDLIPMINHGPSLPKTSSISYPLSSGMDGKVITSTVLPKYPFILKIPTGSFPPSLNQDTLASVEYKLSVFVYRGGKHSMIHEELVFYQGQLSITNLSNQITNIKEIFVDGIRANLELPRQVFLITEKIPFIVRLYDGMSVGVKEVTIILMAVTCVEIRGQYKQSTHMLDTIVFKKFLKREICLKNGKFGSSKTKFASFALNEDPQFKITYEIKMQVTTVEGKTESGSIEVSVGTHPVSLSPPETAPGPSAPPESHLARGRGRVGSRALTSSMVSLALFPPTYSNLPSRSTSMMSMETLPPHYEDLPFS